MRAEAVTIEASAAAAALIDAFPRPTASWSPSTTCWAVGALSEGAARVAARRPTTCRSSASTTSFADGGDRQAVDGAPAEALTSAALGGAGDHRAAGAAGQSARLAGGGGLDRAAAVAGAARDHASRGRRPAPRRPHGSRLILDRRSPSPVKYRAAGVDDDRGLHGASEPCSPPCTGTPMRLTLLLASPCSPTPLRARWPPMPSRPASAARPLGRSARGHHHRRPGCAESERGQRTRSPAAASSPDVAFRFDYIGKAGLLSKGVYIHDERHVDSNTYVAVFDALKAELEREVRRPGERPELEQRPLQGRPQCKLWHLRSLRSKRWCCAPSGTMAATTSACAGQGQGHQHRGDRILCASGGRSWRQIRRASAAPRTALSCELSRGAIPAAGRGGGRWGPPGAAAFTRCKASPSVDMR